MLWLRIVCKSNVQQGPQREQQEQAEVQSYLQYISQDSWYRSCVELIVPSLLHMRSTGHMSTDAASLCFKGLELLLLERSMHESGKMSGCHCGSAG